MPEQPPGDCPKTAGDNSRQSPGSPRAVARGSSPRTTPGTPPSTPVFPGSPQQSPQQFWGIGPPRSLWLVSPVSALRTLVKTFTDKLSQVTIALLPFLVAPYCAIPRDYLSDTPLLRAMGFLVSQHGQLGAIPPPPFLSTSPLESMQSGGAIPPPQKGYLSDTCAIPYENKANGCDTPLCDTISKGYCAKGGGISHWAAKELHREPPPPDLPLRSDPF